MPNLRQEIEQFITRGEAAEAQRSLAQIWRDEPTASTASLINQQFEKLRPQVKLLPHRLAILRSFTVEPIVPFLRAAAFLAGIDLCVYLSDFNAYVREVVDPASGLYKFSPDTILLAVQTRDFVPALWTTSALSQDSVREALDQAVIHLRQWVNALRCHTRAHIIIHNFEQPAVPGSGVLDAQSDSGQRSAIAQINHELQRLCRAQNNAYVLDYGSLVARHGSHHWHDERKWLTVRLPIASPHLNDLAKEWMRFLHPITGKVAKVLVVDLDNTLWKGVIGEDGIDGIQLDVEYPGAAFQQLQRALLDLHARGILLAVCSKNNYDDAIEALAKHPAMLLRPAHFAAMRINWGDKPQNLREIAAELNLGLDSFAFLDDNPLERQQVRTELPGVFVLEPPRDPMELARTVRDCPLFERLSLSREDQDRSAIYQAQRERQVLENSLTSREDFYRSLQQEAEIAPLTRATVARIAQLINKTNQFNLTTRRYSEQQLLELVSSPSWNCFSIGVRDRFGDNGLVGVALLHWDRTQPPVCEIDALLLSCRVIGRTIETAFLWFLAEYARNRGAHDLRGWFFPTKKNSPARDFYSSHGLQKTGENSQGTLWSLNLSDLRLSCPEWIRLRTSGDNDGVNINNRNEAFFNTEKVIR